MTDQNARDLADDGLAVSNQVAVGNQLLNQVGKVDYWKLHLVFAD